jgi:hypothetical protein
MSAPSTPSLATQLALVYPALKTGADYRLSNDGSRIVMWRSMVIDQPTLDALLVAYTAALAAKMAVDKITAAETALLAFFNSLTAVQKKVLWNYYVNIQPLSDHTEVKLLLIADAEMLVPSLALTPAQEALRAVAFTACAAIAAAPAAA